MTTTFGYNEKYILKNDKPWFPIMGEMHYSRYPEEYWRESIYKMKAGGVEVLSSYVIWIHHEEIEGVYEFEGNKNLRKFVELCKECGIYMMLRVGPWVHAEVRNGGFPDWLLSKDFEVRTNDLGYLNQVKAYYIKIYEQVQGLLLKDGGPIIGLQIENEYGHCGGLDGEEGEKHMRLLTQMAKEIGFDVPLYTATGWGGAVTGGLLPVMGGYCEAPWDQRLTDIEPSGNYIFTHERNDHNIGSDYGFGTGITFDINKFPYLTAELGGGLQVTHHRRPVATAEDIGAMSMVKLGSGVNLLGYYMYHGGTNPKGKVTSLQESKETGSINDLPELNYDFRGPIKEYGQVSETFKEIKLLTMFTQDFGEALCQMPADIPESNPLYPTELTSLRTSVRHNGASGYLFVNNYQRRCQMVEHQKVVLSVPLEGETITYPAIDIKNGEFFFYPFNMKLGEACLKSACVTPLCKLDNEMKTYVFYGDKAPCYEVEGTLNHYEFLTLSKQEAKNAWKVKLDKDYLIISENTVLHTNEGIEIVGTVPVLLKVYPAFDKTPEGYKMKGVEGVFTVYEGEEQIGEQVVACQLVEESTEKNTYQIQLPKKATSATDCFISIDYHGDQAKVYIKGDYSADDFYAGEAWELGMKRFDFPETIKLEIFPLKKGAQIFLEQWPEFSKESICELVDLKLKWEYRSVLNWES